MGSRNSTYPYSCVNLEFPVYNAAWTPFYRIRWRVTDRAHLSFTSNVISQKNTLQISWAGFSSFVEKCLDQVDENDRSAGAHEDSTN
jgi:hypothetical protein